MFVYNITFITWGYIAAIGKHFSYVITSFWVSHFWVGMHTNPMDWNTVFINGCHPDQPSAAIHYLHCCTRSIIGSHGCLTQHQWQCSLHENVEHPCRCIKTWLRILCISIFKEFTLSKINQVTPANLYNSKDLQSMARHLMCKLFWILMQICEPPYFWSCISLTYSAT